MTTPESGSQATGIVPTTPRGSKLAATMQPSVANQELAQSIESLADQLTQDLELNMIGDASTRIATAMAEIDLSDTKSILFFGTRAQQQLTQVSDMMLDEVRTKDVGPAGDALNSMVQKLRELDFSDIDPSDQPNWFERLFGLKNEVLKYIDEYETVRDQIDKITTDLEIHKTKLLMDITKLDKLYDANLDYFRLLEVYIAAGRAKLEELDKTVIPALETKAKASEDVVEAQNLRDLRSARDDLERRTHDLLLTRQVTMQSLPSIRLVQENDKALVAKINSTVVNTVPLWRQQLAQAITIFRAGQAAEVGPGGLGPDQRSAQAERQEPAPGQCPGPRADGAWGVRHRGRAPGQRGADRDHRGQPPDRRRRQEEAGRGGKAAGRAGGQAARDPGLVFGPGRSGRGQAPGRCGAATAAAPSLSHF